MVEWKNWKRGLNYMKVIELKTNQNSDVEVYFNNSLKFTISKSKKELSANEIASLFIENAQSEKDDFQLSLDRNSDNYKSNEKWIEPVYKLFDDIVNAVNSIDIRSDINKEIKELK